MVMRCDKEDDTTEYDIESDGHIYIGSVKSVDIMLYPSKDQPDWSKWQCPKPKFDPKTLKPFDRVLVNVDDGADWICELFSYFRDGFCIVTGYGRYKRVIPYNEETKSLVGTSQEAPDFYRYWED